LTFLRRAIDLWNCFTVLTLLFVWVVDDFLEMSECSLRKRQKRPNKGRKGEKKKKECLVCLIGIIVGGSTAHPADLAELLTLFSGENFKCGSISIDERVIFVLVGGVLRIGMKRGAK
jgi:hypothetical protein